MPTECRSASRSSVVSRATGLRSRPRCLSSRRSRRRTLGSSQHVIAEFARIAEVGHLPAAEIVLRHALLGEALELVGIAGGLRAEQAIAADFLGRAAVVDLIELVAAAELGGHAVPQELQELHALLGLVAVGAAQVAVEIGTDLRVLEVARVRVEIDQA